MIEASKQRELATRLKEIWRDRDFILGMLAYTETDDDYDHIMRYIESGDWETASDIIVETILRHNEKNGIGERKGDDDEDRIPFGVSRTTDDQSETQKTSNSEKLEVDAGLANQSPPRQMSGI